MFRRLREITVRKLSHIVSLIIWGCILQNLCALQYDDDEAFIDNEDNGHPNAFPNILLIEGMELIQTAVNEVFEMIMVL